MTKEDKRKVSGEEVSLFEKDLYQQVEDFFSEKKNCEKTGSAFSSSISLNIFGGTIFPDVYGIKNPIDSDFEIYMAEGKRDLSGRNFDICKGQAISLQRFADYVYLFFPKESWRQLTDKQRKEITQECSNLKLGFILVDGNNREEVVSASRNIAFLKDERRAEARDLMVRYFPSFASEVNTQFFEQFSGLAMNIAGESYKLLNECKDVFREKTGGSPVFTHIYYDKDEEYFQIAFQKEDMKPPCNLYLTTNPFGHSLFNKNRSLFILEQWFPFDWYAKKNKIKSLLGYIKKCMNAGSKIKVVFDTGSSSIERIEQLYQIVENTGNQIETIAIHQPIEILGREIRKIVNDVDRSLSNLASFLKSQRKRTKKRSRRS